MKMICRMIGALILTFLVSSCLVYGAAAPEGAAGQLGKYLAYLQEKQARTYQNVPKKVLAFYYPWYATEDYSGDDRHWEGINEAKKDIKSSTHYPRIGAYDSNDPEVIAGHMKMMKDAGVDGVIVSWWGVGGYEERPMEQILDEAGRQGLQVSVYLEKEDAVESEDRIADTAADLEYLVTNFGSHPAFLKVGGAPVIFLYGRVMGQLSDLEWMEAIKAAEQNCGKFILLCDGVNPSSVAQFDGAHDYNPLGWVMSAGDKLKDAALSTYGNIVSMEKGAGKISTVTIIPGYDDTKIRKPGAAADRRNGGTYRDLWEAAITANPDWVLITSFNEWHEGSEIEPSLEYGDFYMNLTKEYSGKFKANSGTKSDLQYVNPLAVSETQTLALRTSFAGKTIGLLPDLRPASPILLWLTRAGLVPAPLSYQEIAGGIDPKRYSILVFGGGENYTATYKEPGDIVRSLTDYLKAGGILVAAPSQPWPFYYDEKGKGAAVTDQLGINISGGWEQPAKGAKLAFQVRNQDGSAAEFPFPQGGDLRWRPVKSKSSKDVYVPFVSLVDDKGRKQGDGAAYVYHQASAPKGGRTVYIWFRLMDQPYAGDLLFNIFQYLGEALKTYGR